MWLDTVQWTVDSWKWIDTIIVNIIVGPDLLSLHIKQLAKKLTRVRGGSWEANSSRQVAAEQEKKSVKLEKPIDHDVEYTMDKENKPNI